jgi:hypothetical protein
MWSCHHIQHWKINMNHSKNGCPVAVLANEARSLENQISEADEARNSAVASRLEAQLTATRSAISHLRPKSVEGANYQLDLIRIYADAMCSDMTGAERFALHLSIQRMTDAVANFLNGRRLIPKAA